MATTDDIRQAVVEIQKKAVEADRPVYAARAGKVGGGTAADLIPTIPAMFEPFYEIPPDEAFQLPIQDLDAALARLSPGELPSDLMTGAGLMPASPIYGDMATVHDQLVDWQGDAAYNFVRNFVNPFRDVTKNQYLAVSVIRALLAAEREMWNKTRNDVLKMAKDTATVLDSVNDCDPAKLALQFTIAGAIIATATADFSGMAIIVWTGVSSGAGVVSGALGLVKNDKPDLSVKGGNVRAILQSLQKGLDQSVELANQTEALIAQAVRINSGIISRDPGSFVTNQPAITGITKQNVGDQDHFGAHRRGTS
ncbi:MAG: hypothetical protein HOV77_19625 [Hamadaea sp.]|uniref:hypothetical protein n=1 Tax=Hamadaea sp. TaxID=2024425 RepID=UPI0017AE4B04|nr:hypothetical protein [Hamadaea sp.]NUT21390.1 hypothetical protein [Hamadaea sp.]